MKVKTDIQRDSTGCPFACSSRSLRSPDLISLACARVIFLCLALECRYTEDGGVFAML
jgi:hypothetical protein